MSLKVKLDFFDYDGTMKVFVYERIDGGVVRFYCPASSGELVGLALPEPVKDPPAAFTVPFFLVNGFRKAMATALDLDGFSGGSSDSLKEKLAATERHLEDFRRLFFAARGVALP